MRILEARDGFIKFESNESVAISSFLEIEDIMKKYIAQVVKITNLESVKVGYAKILYLYDGSLYEYDKTLPEAGATVKPFDYETIKQEIQLNIPIKSGYFVAKDEIIELDSEVFNKKLLVSIDSQENCDKLVSNLKQEFSKTGKVLVIDMLGIVTGRKYTASVDFKLPLNTSSLEFMYEDCLNDATSDSKSLIREIFADLAEYSKTVPFLPFGTLKAIVDDMVNKSHIFKLIVLKNKLAKFDREGYFAATAVDANNLNTILEQKEAVIDLSKLDSTFQNRYLSLIYSAISELQVKPQIFIIASNAINKKNLKTIMKSSEIASTFVTHSRFKYINEIKTMFTNFIIEPSFNANEVFKTYKTFLEAMPKDTYLIIGESTNYIPLVSLNKEFISEPIIETSIEEANNSIDYSDLEVALSDPETEAINKKSEDLIEKITEDLETENSNELNIFDLESENDDDDDENSSFSTKVHPSFESVVADSEEELEATEDRIVETNNLDSEAEELEILEDETNSEAEANSETEENLTNEDSNGEDCQEQETDDEVVSELEDEIIEVEVPDDISDLAEEAIEEYQVIDETLSQEDENRQELVEDTEGLEIEEFSQEEDIAINEESDLIEDDISLPLEVVEEEVAIEEISAESEQEVIVEEDEEEVNITEVIPISEDEEFAEIVELSPEEISEDDILVDFADDEIENEIVDPESLDKEIAEDVDKVFTTMKEDTISDSDLDFIDELNEDVQDDEDIEMLPESHFEELPELEEEPLEDSFVEPLEEINEIPLQKEQQEILETKSGSTPIVPVYDAEIPQEDKVESDSLEQGDSVVHAKYGNGVVEKMIKYGSKTLYSINFDNVGRRLLDPTLTEIKKV